MPAIFISYRREDTGELARLLYAELSQRYGRHRVFMDTEEVRGGERWGEVIDAALAAAVVVIAVIGPEWLTLERGGRARIQHDDDWVRREVGAGLEGRNRLLPLIYSRSGRVVTTMPTAEQLPPDLARLPESQAIDMHEAQITRGLAALERRVDAYVWSRKKRFMAYATILLAVLAAVGGGVRAARPETREVGLDAAGKVQLRDAPSVAALWSPVNDKSSGLYQTDAQGTIHVWRGRAPRPGDRWARVAAARAMEILVKLAYDNPGCGGRLSDLARIRAVAARADLSAACDDLRKACFESLSEAPEPLGAVYRAEVQKTCPP